MASPAHSPTPLIESSLTTMAEPEVGSSSTINQEPIAEPSSPINEETEAKSSSPSAISELQDAFGSLLLARKERPDYRPPDLAVTETRLKAQNQLPPKPEPVVYKWTGAFELFSFPREMRDRVYYHYLDRPKGVRWVRNTTRTWPFDEPESIANLFLVNKQVYEEAYEVFCRFSQISFGPFACDKSIQGTLRLFPEKPAGMLQRVRNTYYGNRDSYGWYRRHPGREPSDNIIQIMRDAHTFKSYFPKVREFTAAWLIGTKDFEECGVTFKDKTEDEVVETWLNWMRSCVQKSNVVPPRWLRFRFENGYKVDSSLKKHEEAMHKAYMLLVREKAPFRDAEKELEESGRKWIEDTSNGGSRKQRRKKRHLTGAA